MSSPAKELAKLSKPSTIFDPQRATVFIEGLEKGASIKDAAVAVGFDPSRIASWVQAGEKSPKGRYGGFALAVNQAKAKRRETLRALVLELSEKANQWTGPMTLLERESPEEYGKPQSGGKGTTINIGIGSFEKSVHALAESNDDSGD